MVLKPSTVAKIILLISGLNLAIAPAIYAAGDSQVSRSAAYALGLLGIVVIALGIYLGFVIAKPERF